MTAWTVKSWVQRFGAALNVPSQAHELLVDNSSKPESVANISIRCTSSMPLSNAKKLEPWARYLNESGISYPVRHAGSAGYPKAVRRQFWIVLESVLIFCNCDLASSWSGCVAPGINYLVDVAQPACTASRIEFTAIRASALAHEAGWVWPPERNTEAGSSQL